MFVDPTAQSQMLAWQDSWSRDGEGRLGAQFHVLAVEDPQASLREGRPIYVDVAYCKIFTPGDPTNVVDRAATEEDKLRFKTQWERFQAGLVQDALGTPLEEWSVLPRHMVEELKNLPLAPVRTVEALAEMGDGVIQRFVGLKQYRERARDWIKAAKADAPLAALRAEVEAREAKLAEVQAQREIDKAAHETELAQLQQRLAALEEKAEKPERRR